MKERTGLDTAAWIYNRWIPRGRAPFRMDAGAGARVLPGLDGKNLEAFWEPSRYPWPVLITGWESGSNARGRKKGAFCV